MTCTAKPTALPDVLILEPRVFEDDRGHFFESFNSRDFQMATGFTGVFVQDNQSRSRHGVLRGLHYQVGRPQGKLVRVVRGEIFDVAVDLRRDSPHFGHWAGETLSGDNRRQLWIPEGFAHGFVVVSDHAEVLYKTTEYWYPEGERSLLWNDPAIGIQWPVARPHLAAKDAAGALLDQAETY
jgi:dTDP-4-dehydrorhamnose 3,5-epimerase